MRSIELGSNPSVIIIAAYAVSNAQVSAVAAAPGWQVIGGLYLPIDAPSVNLEVVGLVLGSGVLSVRLFDVAAAMPVSGSVTADLTSTIDARLLSGAFALPGGKIYQFQAQCVGSADAIIRCAQLV